MQLRIWCAVTGTCAAVLRAGLGGTDQPASGDKEPGGHRSGILDVDFIDRGRNIVALDRGGWLRLWDISTQVWIFCVILKIFNFFFYHLNSYCTHENHSCYTGDTTINIFVSNFRCHGFDVYRCTAS